jgi:hypothetical protein
MSRLRTSVFPCSVLLLLCACLVSCSDPGTGNSKELAPLVGTWRAQALVLTNKVNTSQSLDLVGEGAVFTLSILSSGQYSATMQAFGQSLPPEVGTFRISGNQFTITPTSHDGPPTSGTWRFQGAILILDGDTEYDFNQDGVRELATAHFELARYNP